MAEGEAGDGQGLATESLAEDATDADDVGTQQGGNGEGDDGVECRAGAEIDEGDNYAEDEANDDCVEGDWALWWDLRDVLVLNSLMWGE